MKISEKEQYNISIQERLKTVQKYAELEIEGLAQLTGLSIDTFYSLYSGRRRLTLKTAQNIGYALNFDGSIIFDLNSPIPISIKTSENLKKFRKEYAYNVEFFSKSWSSRKLSKIIEIKLIEKGFFAIPRYTLEVKNALLILEETVNSDLLNKQLKYLVIRGLLKKRKARLKDKSGKELQREVYVYFR